MKTIAHVGPAPAHDVRTLAHIGLAESPGRSRFLRASSLLLSGLLLGLLSGCGSASTPRADNGPSATPVAVVKVTRHNLANQIEVASEFLPFQEIDVYAKVSGYVQKLYVDWGTHVQKGQVLADLEIPELQQQLQQDDANVHRGESDLLRAQEELNRAQSEYSVAHMTYTRLADVQKTQPGLVAQEDIDVSQGKDVQANAGLSAAKDSLAASEQGLLGAKAALEKDKALYAYSHITAPFDGVVTAIHAYTGALLPAGTSSNIGTSALCQLSQNDLLRLVIPVPESAVPDIHIGQDIAVNVSALGRTFTGKIVRFSDQIDVQTRTMHTEVQVPNPKFELVPGMYASVQIPLHTAANVLSLPIQAVQPTGEGKGSVLVVNSQNELEKRDVTLGLQMATEVEILSGLQENELVVFGTQTQYRPGQLVAPKLVVPPAAAE
jgi:RND family efflux transporter MFP subunit